LDYWEHKIELEIEAKEDLAETDKEAPSGLVEARGCLSSACSDRRPLSDNGRNELGTPGREPLQTVARLDERGEAQWREWAASHADDCHLFDREFIGSRPTVETPRNWHDAIEQAS
jgi:hypothetical protein